MEIREFLDRADIIPQLFSTDKTQALRELSRRASAALGIPQETILGAITAREKLGSTGLGQGFALPHARIDGGREETSSQSATPRDNVVFELGLFMGDVGAERAFVVKPRGVALKIPTDLLGMKSLEYDASDPAELTTALAPVCNEIRKCVATLGMK